MSAKGKAKASKAVINREYIFSQKQLKELLGIEGNIRKITEWEGTAPIDENKPGIRDKETYLIETEEADRDG